jgi:hypothetical protein
MILKDKLTHLLDHIVVRVPRIHHDLILVFRGESRFLAEGAFHPIFFVVILIIVVAPVVFRLYGGEPVAVFVLLFVIVAGLIRTVRL